MVSVNALQELSSSGQLLPSAQAVKRLGARGVEAVGT